MSSRPIWILSAALAASVLLTGTGVTGATAAPAAKAPPTWSVASFHPAEQRKVMAVAHKHAHAAGGAAVLPGSVMLMRRSDGMILVSWRLSGGGVDPVSTLSVSLDGRLRYRATIQEDLRRDAAGGGTTRTWYDGKLDRTTPISSSQLAALTPPRPQFNLTAADHENCTAATVLAAFAAAAAIVICAVVLAYLPTLCVALMAIAAAYQAAAQSECGSS